MKIIGLTGKACTGKNIVAQEFENKGFYVIDVDKLGHRVLDDNKEKIIAKFGNIQSSDGKIDRKKLGNIVFSSKKSLRELEKIIHPGIKKIVEEKIKIEENNQGRDVIINAALLERGKLSELCSIYIYVKSRFIIRYKRTKQRDKRNFIWFLKRNFSQQHIKISSEMRKKKVFFITNNKGIDEICRQVGNVCDIL